MGEGEEKNGGSAGPFLVIAKYAFEGRNNDELSFTKNDVILVTQQLEGGWWEGTLDDSIGWFPSDFVSPIETGKSSAPSSSEEATQRAQIPDPAADVAFEKKRLVNRNAIISDYMEKEREHVEIVKHLHQDIISCVIQDSKVLSEEEFSTLVSNIAQILDFLTHMLCSVERQLERPLSEQWIGKVFLDGAQELYPLMEEYCEGHCLAVELIQSRRADLEVALEPFKDWVELKDLVSGLSQVFRHMEKYAGILQEVERNTPESHADRGNLQRASAVYRNMYEHCEFVRKQRAAQVEFIASGVVEREVGKQWKEVLGDFIYLGNASVRVGSSWMDRSLAVFSKSLLLLETLSSGYALKGKVPLEDGGSMQVKSREEEFELSFTATKQDSSRPVLVIRALTNEEYTRVCNALERCGLELISQAPSTQRFDGDNGLEPVDHTDQYLNGGLAGRGLPPTEKLNSGSHHLRLNHELEMILPDGVEGDGISLAGERPPLPPSHQYGVGAAVSKRLYSGWALRPVPSSKREIAPAAGAPIKLRKGLTPEEQEDAQLLKLVDGYFAASSSSIRHNKVGISGSIVHPLMGMQQSQQLGSSMHQQQPPHNGVRRASSYPDEVRLDVARPQLIVAEEEKLFVEERDESGQVVAVKERSLVDTVYSLKDNFDAMRTDFTRLAAALEKEQRARRRLEELLKKKDSGMEESPKLVGDNRPVSSPSQ